MLRQRGYGSECVENGLEAVTIAAANEYDLILMVRLACLQTALILLIYSPLPPARPSIPCSPSSILHTALIFAFCLFVSPLTTASLLLRLLAPVAICQRAASLPETLAP